MLQKDWWKCKGSQNWSIPSSEIHNSQARRVPNWELRGDWIQDIDHWTKALCACSNRQNNEAKLKWGAHTYPKEND